MSHLPGRLYKYVGVNFQFIKTLTNVNNTLNNNKIAFFSINVFSIFTSGKEQTKNIDNYKIISIMFLIIIFESPFLQLTCRSEEKGRGINLTPISL